MSSGKNHGAGNGPESLIAQGISPSADPAAPGANGPGNDVTGGLVIGADQHYRGRGIGARLLFPLLAMGVAYALYQSNATPPAPRPVMIAGLELGEIYGPPTLGSLVKRPAARELKLRLASGSTLIETLTRAGVPTGDAYAAVASLGKHMDPRRLAIGQEITVLLESVPVGGEEALDHLKSLDPPPEWSEKLASLTLRSAFDQYLVTAPATGGSAYITNMRVIPTLSLTQYGAGVIDNSLYLAAERAGLPQEIIVELIRIFSFNVDFQREIRPGDAFEVYFERRATAERLELEEGGILYASMTLRGKQMTFYRFDMGGPKNWDYFDAEGRSARKTLMKTPIDGARLSSHYGRRKHPVLGYRLNHQGVDFSTGRSGTPIYAAGDGIIERSSRYGAYGNYIRIRHNSTYETAYAHLSRYGRGIKSGVRVRQGQIIGYTGSTGRVTGPHLHYEVFVNGKRVNPVTLKLPTGKKLKSKELAAFQARRAETNADLAALRQLHQIERPQSA
ncbi:MAG: peptidoglycan DD-metalloendopeptidase family protein, partial [Proteobacteria bacterium]|nr:peptidoglycan DD-metalloendopeptidase family protein [Pseudomonadota bacterium]